MLLFDRCYSRHIPDGGAVCLHKAKMRERIIFDIGYLETGYDQLFNQLVAFDADQSHFRPYATCLTAKKCLVIKMPTNVSMYQPLRPEQSESELSDAFPAS